MAWDSERVNAAGHVRSGGHAPQAGGRFDGALLRSGLRRASLAGLAGVPERTVDELEFGVGSPGPEAIARVCAVLGVQPGEVGLPAPPPMLVLRIRRRMTVRELAVLADVSEATISRLENKDGKPRYRRVAQGIATALDTTEAELWGPKPWHRMRGKDRGPRAARAAAAPRRVPAPSPRRTSSTAADVHPPRVWVLAAGLLIPSRPPLTAFPAPPSRDLSALYDTRMVRARGILDGIAAGVVLERTDGARASAAARPAPSPVIISAARGVAVPAPRRRGELAPVIIDSRCWQLTMERTLPRSGPDQQASTASATYRRAFRVGVQAAWIFLSARARLGAATRDGGSDVPVRAAAAADAALRAALVTTGADPLAGAIRGY